MVNVNDCVSSDFYRLFKSVSHQNTLIYDEVFKCLPSDKILNFNDLKNFTKQPSLSKTEPADAKLKLEKSVMGLIVDFPLNFLSHEKNFFPDLDTPEGLVPTEMWTWIILLFIYYKFILFGIIFRLVYYCQSSIRSNVKNKPNIHVIYVSLDDEAFF